ncbi:tRNA pseudouridine(13) synthase TruD [Patescibacteria group bacterium]|nr:MAG: tRNA pseudouridine(13) synthase TruD [Patescibacteria group bacterium]
MPSSSDHSLWEREQAFLTKERERVPELFVRPDLANDEVNKRVGILSTPTGMPKGCVKSSPLDFIVEEMRSDGMLSTADLSGACKPLMDGVGTVYADLVKVGISTIDAAGRLATALKLDRKHIGYAGIKDAVALTAQTISFRQTTVDAVKALSIPNLVLTRVGEGKGAVAIGGLKGNRFTLFIRTDGAPDEARMTELVEAVKANGVPNYYGAQRFGTPRYLSHMYGMHVMRGEYEQAVKAVFAAPSAFEIPYFAQRRKRIAEAWGDWKAVRALVTDLPYALRHETQMLAELERGSADMYTKALAAVSQQTDMWVRAYASFLTNLILSEAEISGDTLPDTIPLLLSQREADRAFYKTLTDAHGTGQFQSHLRQSGFDKFVNIGANPSIPSRIKPTMHGFRCVPEGVAISFDLPKGAYATTVLMFLFDVAQGTPEWVTTTEVDTKKLLGTGSVEEAKARLGEFIRQAAKTEADAGE